MAKKVAKKKFIPSQIDRNQFNMKVVTSDVCAKCFKCQRGIDYFERMQVPGAIGYGVPCILTKGKAYK